MMNVGKVANTGIKTPLLTKITSSKAVRNTVTTLGKNVPMITVISVVSKDLVGALILFYQTYHNKRIPEKKRKYLAAYELTSGAYNVAFPLTAGAFLTSDSFKHKTAKAAFKKYYTAPEVIAKATGATQEAMIKNMKTFDKCNKGLAAFVAVVFTAIISKRIICPFVGGPLATVFNKKVLQNNEDKLDKKV